MTNTVKLDLAMPVMALTSSKTVMTQLALGVNLILIVTHQKNAPGNSIPIDTLRHNILHKSNPMNRQGMTHYTKPNLQLLVSTNKSDQMAKLLEPTKKMKKYFKRSLKHHHTLITMTTAKITQTYLMLPTIDATLIHNTK